MSSKRLTLKGRHFIWSGLDWMCHGKILGRLADVTECDAFLLELHALKGDISYQLVVDLDTIVDGQAFELYEDAEACQRAFQQRTAKPQQAAQTRFN